MTNSNQIIFIFLLTASFSYLQADRVCRLSDSTLLNNKMAQ